jgi:protein-tyrosine-phosphatase
MMNVLFAGWPSTGAQMAAALFNAAAEPSLACAVAATSAPSACVPTEVVTALAELDLEVAAGEVLRLELGLAADVLLVISSDPWQADWVVADPSGQDLERVREIRDHLQDRVLELLEQRGWLAADLAA